MRAFDTTLDPSVARPTIWQFLLHNLPTSDKSEAMTAISGSWMIWKQEQ